MKHHVLALVAGLTVIACAPGSERDLIISNITVISAEHDAAVPGQTVVIDNGRIIEIRDADPGLDSGRNVVDGAGRFLAPGLMDTHHHVSFVPGMGAFGVSPASDHFEMALAYMRQQPRSLLYYGVTQILDPSPLYDEPAFLDHEPGPDFFRCGEIPTPGGYPENQQPDGAGEVLQSFRLDEANGRSPEVVVEEIAESGAICVKIYIENGFGAADDWPIFDDETIGRIRDAAHAHGLPVLAHVNAIDAYQVALRNDLDIVAHGLWNWQWPEGEPPVVDTLDAVIAKGTGYMPTHMVMTGLSAQLRADSLDDPALVAVTPSALMQWYRDGGSTFFTEELASGFPGDMPREEMSEILGFAIGRVRQATGYLAAEGHPILLASDCPGSPNHSNQPGLCTYREIQHMAAAGMTPRQILEAGTINPARQFGLEEDFGRVASGQVANLLLLTANPLEDPAAWSSIDQVILRGEVIDRETLRAR